MRTIQNGNSGPLVTYAQLSLRRAGEAPGSLDGFFGSRTESAVKNFQKRYGLAPDGIVGQRTWAELFPYLSAYRPVRIAEGDTMYGLAVRYQSSVDAIRTANPSVRPENLAIGSVLNVPLPFYASAWEVPYSSLLNGIALDGLTKRFPKIRVFSIGRSVLNRPLLAASFGIGGIAVGINAAHHANEWITTPLTLRFLEEYALAESQGGRIGGFDAAELYRRTRLVLVPQVNPDGTDLVTGYLAANDPAFQSAMGLAGSYPRIPFPSGWKANIRGVDLNLGYPAGWERARAIKFAQGYNRPGPRYYVGSAPLSEPENLAMAELTEREAFRLTVSYHTQGAEIYWRYGQKAPVGARRIAEAFAAASGYAIADPDEQSSYAGYKDWFIDAFDLPGFTIEAGRGTNPLPVGDLETLYRENLGIFVNSLALAPDA